MTDDPTRSTRRDLMKPAQLLGLAFGAAVFAFVVTLVSMGFFQQRGGDQIPRALLSAAVVAGITFIVTLVVIALLMLAIDPSQVTKRIDRAVLLDPEVAPDGEAPDAPASGDTSSGGATKPEA